jgi:hypothetical protein
MKELAKQILRQLCEDIVNPSRVGLGSEEIIEIIERILITTYHNQQCEGHESELFEELSLLFDKMVRYITEDLDFDTEDSNLLALALYLQGKDLLEVPQQANRMLYLSAQLNYFVKKYSLKPPAPPEEEKIRSGLLKYLFEENNEFLPFFDVPLSLDSRTSWYKDAFLARIKKYSVPLNYIAEFVWQGVRSIVGLITLPLHLVQFLIYSYKNLSGTITNFITGGVYEKKLLSYLKDSGIEKTFMSSIKDDTMRALFHILHQKREIGLLDLKGQVGWVKQLTKADKLQGEEFFDFVEEHFKTSFVKKEDMLYLMKFEVPSWSNLRILSASYYQAITRSLSEVQGAGNKLRSILVRPLQLLSALVILPLVTVFELAQLVRQAAQYLLSAVLTGFCLLSLAVFIGPIELLDRGLKKIRTQEKPPSTAPSPSQERTSKGSAPQVQSEVKKEEEPQHFSSPLKSADPKKISSQNACKEEKSSSSLGSK